ncbi:hypothetical protein MY10362_000057 [Beauveria mimosiformis]
MAEELGFTSLLWNSMAAVVNEDFVTEFLQWDRRCVAKNEELGIPMKELSLEQLQAIDGQFGEDVSDRFDYRRSVEMRSAKGGTSRARVLKQIKALEAMLA